MKFKLLLTCLLVSALSISLMAQGGQGRGMGQMGEKIKAELNLDETQEAAWTAVNQKYMEELRGLRGDNSMSMDEKRTQMEAIRTEWNAELSSILDEEQLAKWENMKAEGQAQAQERKGERKARNQERMAELSEKVKTELELTDEQAMQWEALNQTYTKKMKAITADGSLTREEQKEQLQTIQAEKTEELSQILTPEQMEEWTSMKEEGKVKMQERKRTRERGNRQ